MTSSSSSSSSNTENYASMTIEELYKKVEKEEVLKLLVQKYPHNPDLWLHAYNQLSLYRQNNNNNNKNKDKDNKDNNNNTKEPLIDAYLLLRCCQKLIQKQTLNILQKGQYSTSDGSIVRLNANKELKWMAQNTKYYKGEDIASLDITNVKNETEIHNDIQHKDQNKDEDKNEDKDNKDTEQKKNESTELSSSSLLKLNKQKYGCEIYVVNGDSIDVGSYLLFTGFNPVVLNMANDKKPGGGFIEGAHAQEENLFRRTSYVCSLLNSNGSFSDQLDKKRKWSYPIDEFGCIYSPKLWVFRSNQNRGYTFLHEPFRMSFIAAAMYRFPKYDPNTRRLDDATAKKVAEKYRSLLRVAYHEKHDALVLSAWGCGAFANPPEHQAEIVSQVLQEKEFYGKFKVIAFAILDDFNAHKQHNPNGNFVPFEKVFGKMQFFSNSLL